MKKGLKWIITLILSLQICGITFAPGYAESLDQSVQVIGILGADSSLPIEEEGLEHPIALEHGGQPHSSSWSSSILPHTGEMNDDLFLYVGEMILGIVLLLIFCLPRKKKGTLKSDN